MTTAQRFGKMFITILLAMAVAVGYVSAETVVRTPPGQLPVVWTR